MSSPKHSSSINPLIQNPDGSGKWKNPTTVMQRGDSYGIPADPQPAAESSRRGDQPAKAAPTPAIVALSKSLANDLGPYYRWQNLAERIEEATETRETAAELERVKQQLHTSENRDVVWRSDYERVKLLLAECQQQRDKAIQLLKDIATEQIRGATQPQIRSMLVDAIADLEGK